jgi:hypothetical protein
VHCYDSIFFDFPTEAAVPVPCDQGVVSFSVSRASLPLAYHLQATPVLRYVETLLLVCWQICVARIILETFCRVFVIYGAEINGLVGALGILE